MTVKSSGDWDGSCRFEHVRVSRAETIEINGSKMELHPCPGGSKAVPSLVMKRFSVRVGMKTGLDFRHLVGRVRDAYFLVTMINVAAAIREPGPEVRPVDRFEASPLQRVAEQVAGNLF